jgi:hypothetical protein
MRMSFTPRLRRSVSAEIAWKAQNRLHRRYIATRADCGIGTDVGQRLVDYLASARCDRLRAECPIAKAAAALRSPGGKTLRAYSCLPKDSSSTNSKMHDSENRGMRRLFHQTTNETATVRISAVTEMIVSQTDQVLIVWVTLILRYSFTSQKPPSLTWEKINDPAPVAIANNSG